MVVRPRAIAIAAILLVGAPRAGGPTGAATVLAQQALPPAAPQGIKPALPQTRPAPFKPDGPDAAPQDVPQDTWIFSGALNDSHETFSGTLLTGAGGTDFEFKLGNGATCTGGDLKGEPGIVRLSEITCSDDRRMRALFVPQGGTELKVFGHVGEERFAASAHLLGTEDAPEPKQSAQPRAPKVTPDPPAEPGAEPGAKPVGKPRDG